MCCLWKARLPQRRHRVCDLVCRLLYAWRIVRRCENERRNCETYPNEVVPIGRYETPIMQRSVSICNSAAFSIAYEPFVYRRNRIVSIHSSGKTGYRADTPEGLYHQPTVIRPRVHQSTPSTHPIRPVQTQKCILTCSTSLWRAAYGHGLTIVS